MNEHVTPWLNAYRDGELRGLRLRQVEAHLAQCPVCRAELDEITALSTLLQESPAAEGLMPVDRFVAQVGLRLPRRPERTAWQQVLETGWRLTPVGLLGAWAFVQTVFIVAGVVWLALWLGVGGETAAGLLPPAGSSWLAQLPSLSGATLTEIGRFGLSLLRGGGLLGWGSILNVALIAAIGLLYWTWLATWWARRQRQGRLA